jgi:hypothetical protein
LVQNGSMIKRLYFTIYVISNDHKESIPSR